MSREQYPRQAEPTREELEGKLVEANKKLKEAEAELKGQDDMLPPIDLVDEVLDLEKQIEELDAGLAQSPKTEQMPVASTQFDILRADDDDLTNPEADLKDDSIDLGELRKPDDISDIPVLPDVLTPDSDDNNGSKENFSGQIGNETSGDNVGSGEIIENTEEVEPAESQGKEALPKPGMISLLGELKKIKEEGGNKVAIKEFLKKFNGERVYRFITNGKGEREKQYVKLSDIKNGKARFVAYDNDGVESEITSDLKSVGYRQWKKAVPVKEKRGESVMYRTGRGEFHQCRLLVRTTQEGKVTFQFERGSDSDGGFISSSPLDPNEIVKCEVGGVFAYARATPPRSEALDYLSSQKPERTKKPRKNIEREPRQTEEENELEGLGERAETEDEETEPVETNGETTESEVAKQENWFTKTYKFFPRLLSSVNKVIDKHPTATIAGTTVGTFTFGILVPWSLFITV